MSDNITPGQSVRVRLWVDPVCPWCWVTYLWLREVEKQRAVSLDIALMSLAYLNEGKPGVPEEYKAPNAKSLALGRVLAAAVATHGPSLLAPMYDRMGRALHSDGIRDFDVVIQAALNAVGLSADDDATSSSPAFDGELRSATEEFVLRAGKDAGTPVVELDGVAFFGPVLSRKPVEEDAGQLFDAILVLARYPHFFELKRNRTENPVVRSQDG